ncbi:MAG: hypothetical protein RJA44_501, partial [Pseudomonadota bacterium]
LFERTGRRLRPTDLAQSLQEPAQRMHAVVQALGPLTQQQQRGTLEGTVRISASELVACCVLPAVLAELAELHPEISVELVATPREDHLLEQEADLAVRVVRPSQSAMIARYLGDWRLGLYAHERYLAGLGGAVELEQLEQYRWIGLDQNPQLIDLLRQAGQELERSSFKLRSDSLMVGLAALQAGLGIGLLTRPVAQLHPALQPVLPDLELGSLPIWLVANRELRGSRRLRVVFDHVADALFRFGNDGAPVSTLDAALA